MSYIKPDTPYPVYAQPSMTGNAIIETQHNEKASLAMTTTSLLTAMSIACQNQIDVCNPGIYVGLLIFTLWFWLIPEKGKRPGKVLVK